MTSTIILDNPSVTLWFHPDTGIVHHKIHKFIWGKEFREFLQAGAKVLAERRARKWLSDDRGNSVLSKEDLEWSHASWAPQVVRAGWKYWAIVQPEKVLAQFTMQGLVTKYAGLGVSAKFFTDPQAAMRWLEGQP